MSTRVVNKRRHSPTPADVYIGRGSKWGNPFKIGEHGDRAAVIAQYARHIQTRPDLLASLPELRGKTSCASALRKPVMVTC